jgi:hypothetical protein
MVAQRLLQFWNVGPEYTKKFRISGGRPIFAGFGVRRRIASTGIDTRQRRKSDCEDSPDRQDSSLDEQGLFA